MSEPQGKNAHKQENPLFNIAFNIVLPVIILEKLSSKIGPTTALFVALAFPVGYGSYDYFLRKKKNLISVLGVANVMMTGGLALMKLEGIWFAVKEAAFPLLLGIGVTISAFTTRPFMKAMIMNPGVLNVDLINQKIKELGNEIPFEKLIVSSTHLMAISFYLSSLLNYLLARHIFKDIDPGLPEVEFQAILNGQVSQMTWQSFIVIVFPLMIFMILVMWRLIKGLRKITHLDFNDIFPQK